MKFAYVLVSGVTDIYYEQMLVSMVSLKHWNPDAFISLVTDDESSKTFTGKFRTRHEKYVSEIRVVELPRTYNGLQKSRFLKTNLREYLEGDFLYLDTDTIVVDEISENEFLNPIMGVQDWHMGISQHPMKKYIMWGLQTPNFYSNVEKYINGGILWMKDVDVVHDFSKLWHELWLESSRRKVSIDQPALSEANYRMGDIIQLLPGEYNAQISATLKYLSSAKIIHCFASSVNGSRYFNYAYEFLNPNFYQSIKESEISKEQEDLIFNAKKAFCKPVILLLDNNAESFFRTPLCGFFACLYTSKKGRPLFNILNKVVQVVTNLFWGKKESN